MQQRLRWNAATVHTNAARIHLGIDERGTQAEIRGKKRGGVPPRSATDDDDLSRGHEDEMQPRKHEGTKKKKKRFSSCRRVFVANVGFTKASNVGFTLATPAGMAA
jgi:hypothetical protein